MPPLLHKAVRGTFPERAVGPHVRPCPTRAGGRTDPLVERPTPLGRRARLQLAGLSSASRHSLLMTPHREQIVRPLDDYVRMVEALR